MRIQDFLHIKHGKGGQAHEDKVMAAKHRHESTGKGSSPRSGAPSKKGLFSADRTFQARHAKKRKGGVI